MMIEHEYKMLIIFLLIIIAMVVATIAIPVYGYRRKRRFHREQPRGGPLRGRLLQHP